MKLINQSAEYLPQPKGLEGIYKQIELAGRTSYLSWNKMTDDSAKKFVDMLIKSKHLSCLEHGTVYLMLSYDVSNAFSSFDYPSANFTAHYNWSDVVRHVAAKYRGDKYSKVVSWYNGTGDTVCITSNLRVLQENDWLDDLQFLCEPIERHEKRLSVKVVTDIGVTREFNRHRTFSITEQSTRYCNFSKDNLGGEIQFVIPYIFKDVIPEGELEDVELNFHWAKWKCAGEFLLGLEDVEAIYNIIIQNQYAPQGVRSILPLCTKTEAVYTAFESDWRHFFDQRLFGKTGQPHPDMLHLAELIKEQFEKNGLWEGIMKHPSKYEQL